VELFRTRGCLEYGGSEPRCPMLNVTVRNPITEDEDRLVVPVDTGFGGYLLLSKEVYDRFATAEVPAEDFMVYSTMAGPVVLRKARAALAIGGLTLQTYIETPYHGPGRDLIGRRLLRMVDIALLGERESCCLLEKP
jgi:predicted aspartyl protease